MASRSLAQLLLLLLLLLLCAAALSAAETTRPNIVFVMIDTLRADHLGCYGYQRQTSPRIDRLASEGARWERMIAASSWTLPSVMSMFTGLPPSLHGVVDTRHKLKEGVTTLAAELRRAGYQTAGITANPIAHTRHGFGLGFDIYDDYSIPLAAGIMEVGEENPELRVTGSAVTRSGLTWLERKRRVDAPFFLYLHYFDPHADYLPPPPYDRSFTDPAYDGKVAGRLLTAGIDKSAMTPADRSQLMALYDGEIAYTDDQIGILLDGLDRLGLTGETLVVLTSDHGEQFWDHGGILHGDDLHDELIHVPFIMRWPGQLAPGTALSDPVAHTDVMPTLLQAAGIMPPTAIHGRSLLGQLRGAAATHAAVFSETRAGGRLLCALRSAERKLIWDVEANTYRAYDLVTDPGERNNLADQAPPWFAGAVKNLTAWSALTRIRDVDAPADRLPPLDPVTIEQLRSMGYFH